MWYYCPCLNLIFDFMFWWHMHQQWQRFLHLLYNSLPHTTAMHAIQLEFCWLLHPPPQSKLHHNLLNSIPCSPDSSQSTNLLLPFIFTNQFTLIKQMKLSNITLDYNENNKQGGSCLGLPFLPQYNQSNIKIILQNFHGDLMKQT